MYLSNESVLKNDIRTVNLVLFKVLVLVLLLTIQMLIIGTVQVLMPVIMPFCEIHIFETKKVLFY